MPVWFSIRFKTSRRARRTVHNQGGAPLMHVSVNGVRLFFDVEGAKFVPDGPVMREKPVLLMLHGGPGADHSIYKPAYSAWPTSPRRLPRPPRQRPQRGRPARELEPGAV